MVIGKYPEGPQLIHLYELFHVKWEAEIELCLFIHSSFYYQLYLNKREEAFCFPFDYFWEVHSVHLRPLVFAAMHIQ